MYGKEMDWIVIHKAIEKRDMCSTFESHYDCGDE